MRDDDDELKYVFGVMRKCTALYEKTGKSLDDIGRAMGYSGELARKSAWQFLNKTGDPRLSMLRRFAKAVDVEIKDLLADDGEGGR